MSLKDKGKIATLCQTHINPMYFSHSVSCENMYLAPSTNDSERMQVIVPIKMPKWVFIKLKTVIASIMSKQYLFATCPSWYNCYFCIQCECYLTSTKGHRYKMVLDQKNGKISYICVWYSGIKVLCVHYNRNCCIVSSTYCYLPSPFSEVICLTAMKTCYENYYSLITMSSKT